MNRQAFFNPFFGPGFFPFFGPFGFPRRRFFPFFFFSPFRFPFFRDEARNGDYYTPHHCKMGDTMESLAEMYNVPRPVLEAVNPHIQNPAALVAGSTIHVPRMNRMFCQRMYAEFESAPNTGHIPMQSTAPWMTPAVGGVQTAPWTYMPMGTAPNQAWASPAYGMPPTAAAPASNYPGLRTDEDGTASS